MGLAVALGFRRLSNLSLACYPSLRSACPHVKSTSPPSSPLFYPIPSSHVPQSESLSESAPSVDVSLTSASSLPLCGSRAGLLLTVHTTPYTGELPADQSSPRQQLRFFPRGRSTSRLGNFLPLAIVYFLPPRQGRRSCSSPIHRCLIVDLSLK